MALITLGANAITALPAGVGGKVLQVVSFSTSTALVTSSTSFVDSNVSLAITPSLASSKIFISTSTSIETNSANARTALAIYRDATELTYNLCRQSTASGSPYYPLSMNYLDSPNTTSAITYYVKIKASDGIVTVAQIQSIGTITLMEIAG